MATWMAQTRRYLKETRGKAEGTPTLFQEKLASWVGEMAKGLGGIGAL